jgi:hypothetical protein
MFVCGIVEHAWGLEDQQRWIVELMVIQVAG